MERKFRICDAMNTWMPALNILRKRGYKLYISPDHREEFYGDFWAIKDGRDFIARDPLALFGLIAIWEEHGDSDSWQPKNQDYQDIQDELGDIAFPDDEYEDLSEEKFREVIAYWRDFFDACEAELEEPISKKVLYDFFTKEEIKS